MRFPYRGISRLPAQMDDLVWSISCEMNTNDQMVVPMLLSILASILQAKFEVHFRDSEGRKYEIPLALFTLLVAESGAGKSPIFKKLISPLDELIEENNRLREEENFERRNFNEGLGLVKKMVKKEITKYKMSMEKIGEILNHIEKKKIGLVRPADIYTTNCTSAGITRALAEQEGHRISLLDPEGSSILMLKKDETLSSRLNQAFDHEKFSAQRASGDYSRPIKGIMSLLMCIQPAKYETIFGRNDLWYQGLIPRVLPFSGEVKEHLLLLDDDRRRKDEKNLTFQYYKERLNFLFHYPWNAWVNEEPVPHILKMSEDAIEMFKEFEWRFSPQSSSRSECLIQEWKSKEATTIIRLAAIFHLYTIVGDPVETPITEESVEIAGKLIESLIPNVEDVRSTVAPTAMEDVTRRVIHWLLNNLPDEVSLRDLSRAINTSNQLILPTILKFRREGVLREIRTEHTSPGRPRSPRFTVNWERLRDCYL